jgi:hypothetical protein
MPGISNGICGVSGTSISMSLSESSPAISFSRKRSRVADARLGRGLRLFADTLALGVAHQPDRFLDEVADDLVDVAADVADLGELGRLYFQKRRLGELRQPPADLGLAAARWPDHQDVLRGDFVAHRFGQLLPPPAVAKRNGDRALRLVLADDVAVERRDHRLGGEARDGVRRLDGDFDVHARVSSVSMVRLVLV